jgi:hypothetical protein
MTNFREFDLLLNRECIVAVPVYRNREEYRKLVDVCKFLFNACYPPKCGDLASLREETKAHEKVAHVDFVEISDRTRMPRSIREICSVFDVIKTPPDELYSIAKRFSFHLLHSRIHFTVSVD